MHPILESGLKFKWMAAIRVDLFSRARLSDEDALRVAKKMKRLDVIHVFLHWNLEIKRL